MGRLRDTEHSATGRLGLLLPWVSGNTMPNIELRLRLAAFVDSFDGSEAASCIEVRVGPREPDREVKTTLSEQLDTLRLIVRDVLQGNVRKFQSLQFSQRAARRPESRGKLTARQRKIYDAAGGRVLRVEGPLMELVPFLVMHLMTAPGMMALSRCTAPKAYAGDDECGNWFVQKAGRAGRPRAHCSDRCKVRAANRASR
jgi:hypothetical protein